MARHDSLAKKLGLALAGLLLTLVGVELFFRFVRPIEFMRIRPVKADARGRWYGMIHRPSTTPGLPYELVPLIDQDSIASHVKTNSLGMRDDEPLPRDTPGLFRILAIGDSVTFGYRVAQDENFCGQLEKQFAAQALDSRRIEVLNAGVSGYSSRDEAAALEGKWLALEPDLVLLGYSMNDPEFEPRQPLQRYFVPPHWWQHSSALRFLVQLQLGRKVHDLGGGSYFRYLHAPSEPPWRSVVSAFTRIAELSRQRKIPVLLVIFPFCSPEPWSKYPFRKQHAQVAEEGERHGFMVINMLRRFQAEDPASLLISPDDSHPNAAGHRLAALEIQQFIEEHWDRIRGAK